VNLSMEIRLRANNTRIKTKARRARFAVQRSRAMIQQIGFFSRKRFPAGPEKRSSSGIRQAGRAFFSCQVFGASQLAAARQSQPAICTARTLSQKSAATGDTG